MTDRPSPASSVQGLFSDPDPRFSICVYCASQPGVDERFADAAREVGSWIARHGGQLVYGGGHNGLMGVVADAALQAGGRVVGVIPKALVEREWAHHACTELHIVETMHQRKHMMAERCTAFLALAGGIGTFEELFEAWTWKQLGYHDKPVAVLNTAGYYDHLMTFLQGSVNAGFMKPYQMEMIHVGTEVAPTLEYLVQG
ncbi:TIGR00730 family Rossman fold protein [Brachymonas sp. G13]|uniref:LOG family protein n=1 Tax=Brachymonas TaxID=28219 RepID=UPI0016B1E881|nr:TIGR00730 family Rossman fold protein [Brachymonas sp. J145]MEE1654307.1 TIGR00730 family Rossman fold protein [Brachymonas sp. J145]NLX16611.1 TIGR00730 family Rossman fold protein [Ramlibacter sp.]